MCDEEYTNINPEHYRTGKFECIDVMREALGDEAVMGFCVCNAFKYIYRHRRKNGVEDIEKAQWYINKYLEINKDYNCVKQETKAEMDTLAESIYYDQIKSEAHKQCNY